MSKWAFKKALISLKLKTDQDQNVTICKVYTGKVKNSFMLRLLVPETFHRAFKGREILI